MDTQCSRRENQAIIRLTRGVFSIDLLPLLPTIKTSVPQINILSHKSKSLKHTITKTVGQSALNHPPLEIKISKEINAKDGKWQDEGPRCRWYRNGDRISTYCFPLCSRFPIYNSSSLKAVIILNCRQEKGIFRKQSRAKFSHFDLIHFLRYTKANLPQQINKLPLSRIHPICWGHCIHFSQKCDHTCFFSS